MWIVEAVPKDPYYSAGRLIHYVDKDNYTMYFKVVYTHGGDYWKTVIFPGSCAETEGGVRYFTLHSVYLIRDDKNHHTTTVQNGEFDGVISQLDLPSDVFGPDFFTEANIRQLSK